MLVFLPTPPDMYHVTEEHSASVLPLQFCSWSSDVTPSTLTLLGCEARHCPGIRGKMYPHSHSHSGGKDTPHSGVPTLNCVINKLSLNCFSFGWEELVQGQHIHYLPTSVCVCGCVYVRRWWCVHVCVCVYGCLHYRGAKKCKCRVETVPNVLECVCVCRCVCLCGVGLCVGRYIDMCVCACVCVHVYVCVHAKVISGVKTCHPVPFQTDKR